MSLTVLRMAIDTLECSIGGRIRPHVEQVLDMWKLQAQEDETPTYSPMGGLDFAVQAQGSSPYRWVMKGDDATVRVTPSPKLPGASVRLSAKGLAYYEPAELLGLLVNIVADYLGPNEEPKTSRLDQCADVQGFDFGRLDGAQFVCPASFRPVYPNIDHPETYQFGRGKVVVRVYNKSRELRVSGKTWVPALWGSHPDYDPTQDVWRVEVQYRRDALVELGAGTPAEAFAMLPELMRYGLSWADLRIPNGSSSEHWPRHPAWEALAEATGTHTVLERTSRSASLGELAQIVAAVAGYVKSAGAVLDVYDFNEVWRILGNRACVRLGEDVDFAASVRRRRLQRLGRESS